MFVFKHLFILSKYHTGTKKNNRKLNWHKALKKYIDLYTKSFKTLANLYADF